MNIVDFSFAEMSSSRRSLDFVLIMELASPLSVEALQDGAEKAFLAYPKSACRFSGKKWIPDNRAWTIAAESSTAEDRQRVIEDFIATELDVHTTRGIRQLLVQSGDTQFLATRFHHALGDGLSLMMWLNVQMGSGIVSATPLELKKARRAKSVSAYKRNDGSDPIGNRNGISNRRRWGSFELPYSGAWNREKGYSYNDALTASVLQGLYEWADSQRDRESRFSIYLPVNIRANPFQGFGNGSSRLKVYLSRDEIRGKSKSEVSTMVREQVRWCRANGLWHVPSPPLLSLIPKSVLKNALSRKAKSPSSDFCSLVFSHVEKLESVEAVFAEANSLEIVSQLYESYSCSIAATTLKGKTLLTLTWDPAQLSESEAKSLLESIEVRCRAHS